MDFLFWLLVDLLFGTVGRVAWSAIIALGFANEKLSYWSNVAFGIICFVVAFIIGVVIFNFLAGLF